MKRIAVILLVACACADAAHAQGKWVTNGDGTRTWHNLRNGLYVPGLYPGPGAEMRETDDRYQSSSARDIYPIRPIEYGIKVPKFDSPGSEIAMALADNKRTIWYKFDQVYQHRTRDGWWAVFGTDFLKDYNANRVFPWETTFGLNAAHQRAKSPYGTINFVHFPVDDSGRIRPVLVLDDERPVKWLFPNDILFGEVIYVTRERDGKKLVQEVRTRTKRADGVEVAIYRPIATRDEFVACIGRDYLPAKKHFHFRNPDEDEVMLLDGYVDRLPDLSAAMVEKMLAMPFKEVTSPWSRVSHSPSADTDFHIVPKDYVLGLLKPGEKSCINCHRQTMATISHLVPKEPFITNAPEKVGFIRGSDGIFTWHPFDLHCVNADDDRAKAIVIRQHDLRMGYVVLASEHGERGRDYRLSRFVERSLSIETLPAKRYLSGE